MRHQETIRISTGRSSDAPTRCALAAARRLADAGLIVRFARRANETTSIETLVTALVEESTDCIVVPGDAQPRILSDGFSVAAVLPRQSTRLFLVGTVKTLKPTAADPIGLPPSSTVAVPSVGQQAQLLALRPDLNVIERTPPLQGLASDLKSRTLDAVLLAADEGFHSDLEGLALVSLRPEVMLPSPGSATSLVVAKSDNPLAHHLAFLDDCDSRRCLAAEHALSGALDWPAGLACLATPVTGGAIRLQASLPNGDSDPRSALVRVGAVATSPEAVAELCFVALRESM